MSRSILVLLMAVVVPVSAQLSPAEIRRKPDASFEEVVSLPLVYKAPNLDRVIETRDLVYKKLSEGDLRMDVYTPRDSAASHPVVLFIHGGVSPDDHPKDWGIYQSWGRTIAASGLVAVIPNQRLGYPARRYEQGSSDVRDAMEFVRTRRHQMRAADRFCVIAFSGGGTMLAPFLKSTPSDVKCLVGFYPILDTADANDPQAEVTEEQRREYSAVATLENYVAPTVPIFIARAGRDQIPGVKESIEKFTAAALQKNANLTLMNHSTGKHGFDTWNDDDRSREIIKAAIEFMKVHLRPSS
jgi:dienelactone hydrolase